MKSRRYLFPVQLLVIYLGVSFSNQAHSNTQADWTEEKIGKLAVQADRAASRKDWGQAINHGEKMLSASAALYPKSELGYIRRLKTLNRYYDKADRLGEVADRVREAYMLSKNHLPPDHHITKMGRMLYYKILIEQQDYETAVQVVKENMAILGSSEEDAFRQHHYLRQLYSLYGLLGQLEEEEKAIIRFLELDERLIGSTLEENMELIIRLAQNYCQQGKVAEFNNLMKTYDLKYKC